MASNEWCLSENDSDEGNARDESGSGDRLDLGGFTIPPWRVLQLMQMVDQKKTIELDSVGETYKMRRIKKKKKRKKKLSKGGRGIEDVSETASEIRSTTGTSTTATECRDSRRPGLFAYDDPELDDVQGLPAPRQLFSRKRVLLPPTFKKQQQRQRASLDKIAAEEQERRQRWKKAQLEVLENSATPPQSSSTNHSDFSTLSNSIPVNSEVSNFIPDPMNSGERLASGSVVAEAADHEDVDLLSFGEDSDDDDDEYGDEGKLAAGGGKSNHTLPFLTGTLGDTTMSDSDLDEVTLLSQINRVEQLLDSDGLT